MDHPMVSKIAHTLPAMIGVFACCPFKDDASEELAANIASVAVEPLGLTTSVGIVGIGMSFQELERKCRSLVQKPLQGAVV